MSAATTDPMSAVSDEELKQWWTEELDDFQRSALSAALEVAEDGAVMEISQKTREPASVWFSQSDATKEEALSRHFNEALNSIMSLQPALPSTDGSFREIARPDYEVITAEYSTNKSRRDIRSKATTKDDPFPCPSTFTGANYGYNQHEGLERLPQHRWLREIRQECDRFDSTRMMAIMALNCSSLDEATGIASSEHCPSGFKDDKTGFTSLYSLLHHKILPEVKGASPWDTTRNRQPRPLSTQSGDIMRKSAMRITRRHFDDMGLSQLPQTLALDEHLARKRSEGDIGQISDTSGAQVSFDTKESLKSANAASERTSRWSSWVPSWLSRSKPTTEPNSSTTGTGIDSTTVPATLNTATTNQTHPSDSHSTTNTPGPVITNFPSAWAGGNADSTTANGSEVAVATQSPHFGFSSSVSQPASSPLTQNPTRGAPFRGVTQPTASSSGSDAPLKSSLLSKSVKRNRQVQFGGIAPGAREGASTDTKRRRSLSSFFRGGKSDKIDGKMLSSPAPSSCRTATGAGSTPTTSALTV